MDKTLQQALDTAALIVLVIGGVAWGLHAFYIDPVDMVLKSWARWAYALVGVAAVYYTARACKLIK